MPLLLLPDLWNGPRMGPTGESKLTKAGPYKGPPAPVVGHHWGDRRTGQKPKPNNHRHTHTHKNLLWFVANLHVLFLHVVFCLFRLFVGWFVCLFDDGLVCLSLGLFVCLCVCLFVCWFGLSFVLLFFRLFVRLFVCCVISIRCLWLKSSSLQFFKVVQLPLFFRWNLHGCFCDAIFVRRFRVIASLLECLHVLRVYESAASFLAQAFYFDILFLSGWHALCQWFSSWSLSAWWNIAIINRWENSALFAGPWAAGAQTSRKLARSGRKFVTLCEVQ